MNLLKNLFRITPQTQTERTNAFVTLTAEQSQAVSAGNDSTTVKEKPTEKPSTTTTTNSDTSSTIPAAGAQRPPFN